MNGARWIPVWLLRSRAGSCGEAAMIKTIEDGAVSDYRGGCGVDGSGS
jgi:hypothetical protein